MRGWQINRHVTNLTQPTNHARPLSDPLKAQQGLGVGLGWLCGAAGTPSLFTYQFQADPHHCSRQVASIIERIDLGCASNQMWVLIILTAAVKPQQVRRSV